MLKRRNKLNGFTLMNRTSEGFTLIELLIVVVIIALLIVLVIIILLKNITKANDARRKADIAKISTAMEEYYTDNNCYPDPAILTSCGSNALQPYLASVPCDPVYKYPYCYFAQEPSPTATCYQKYRTLATLKNLSDPDIKAAGCDKDTFCGWESECGATTNRFGFNYGVASRNTFLANPNVVLPTATTPPGLPEPGGPGPYACAWDGVCNNFGTSQQALNQGCPTTYASGVICQQYCDYSNSYWCPKP